MDYQIIRSNRRTVALTIDRQGNLVVRAPQRVNIAEVEKFVALKQRWIQKHRQQVLARIPAQNCYRNGGEFLFLGQGYPLRITGDYHQKLHFYQGEFILSERQLGLAKSLFADWYRTQAKYLLPKRAGFWAAKMGVSYSRLTITGAQTRWGSCSAQGSINFSWRLMAAPLEVVDYVVIHELAHLTHRNHSQKFWREVEWFMPDYRAAKIWLNRQGQSGVI